MYKISKFNKSLCNMKVCRLAPKCYPKHFRKIKFDDETYWQRNSNLDTVCLFEKEYVAKWHSTDVLDSQKD